MKLCYFLLSLFLVSSSSAKARSYDSNCQTIILNPSEEEDLEFSFVIEHANNNNGRPKTLPILPEAFISGNSLYFRNGCTHAQLSILSSDGATVLLNEIINNGDVVSVQDLPVGVYCVQIIRDSCTFAAIINVR